MRISHSSSLLLATLAISTSTTMAAPTEQNSLSDQSAFPSSSSVHSFAERDTVADVRVNQPQINPPPQGQGTAVVQFVHDRRQLDDLLTLLQGVPLVGDALTPLVKNLLGIVGLIHKTGSGVSPQDIPAALDALSPEQVTQLQKAVAKAAEGLQSTASSLIPGSSSSGVENRTPGSYHALEVTLGASPSDSSMSTPTQQSVASFARRDESGPPSPPSAPADAGPAPAPPSVPPLPISPPVLPISPPALPVSPPALSIGPPTLPVSPPALPIGPSLPALPPLPVDPGSLPFPAGVSPPTGAIIGNAPPMFPDIKAADASSVASPSSSGCPTQAQAKAAEVAASSTAPSATPSCSCTCLAPASSSSVPASTSTSI